MQSNRLEQILQFLKEDPADTFMHFALAKEYEKSKLLQEADETYIKLLALDDEYTGAYYHRGKLLEMMNLDDQAASLYQQGIAVAQKKNETKDLAELREALALL